MLLGPLLRTKIFAMKIKLLLSIASLFVALSTFSQVVEIPDPNFLNRLLNPNPFEPIIDTNNDGQIQVSEAGALTGNLNLFFNEITQDPSQRIQDLTGLEAFINITNLNISGNAVSELNTTSNNSLTSIQAVSYTHLTLPTTPYV